MIQIIIFCLIGFIKFSFQANDEKLCYSYVQTTSGHLNGVCVNKLNGIEVIQYLGVPYALQPTEKRRFRKPEAIYSPSIQINATEFAATCMQMMHVPSMINPLLNVNMDDKVNQY